MRKTPVWITLSCCLFALAMVALAQAVRKPGLWEMTSTMTWQQSPFPPGMPPGAAAAMGGGGPRTTQVCLSQAMIDKYGAPVSQNRDCQITNVVMKPTGMTAEMVCTGKMSGHGEMESSWTDGNVAKGKVHFVGTMAAGPNSMPVEWTVASTSVYKGPDCGNVKPMAMPSN
jgi:Protein of unknown function (DUF3617)